MDFKEELPIWNAEGIKPTDTVINEGYSPGDKPPADWFNWNFNRTYLSLKEIRENIGLLDKDVDTRLKNYWGKDELEIGGRNLVQDSKNGIELKSNNQVRDPIKVTKTDDYQIIELLEGATMLSTFSPSRYDVDTLDDYTTSYLVMSDNPMSINILGGGQEVKLKHKVWTKIYNTVNRTESGSFRVLGLYSPDMEVGQKLYYKKVKVEKGSIPTDWTPAPEDIEVQLEQAGKVKSVNKKTGDVVLTGTDIQLSKSNTSSIDTVLTNYMSKTDKEIDTVKQSGVESNKSLVEALNSKGVSASTNDNIKTNVSKVNQIDTDPSGNTTAVSGDLLQGKTAYSQKKQIVGTMPNIGSQRSAVTKDGYYVAIKEGYHDGTGRVTSRVENLKPEVIKKGEVVGGVTGNYIGEFNNKSTNVKSDFRSSGKSTHTFNITWENKATKMVVLAGVTTSSTAGMQYFEIEKGNPKPTAHIISEYPYGLKTELRNNNSSSCDIYVSSSNGRDEVVLSYMQI